MNQGIEIRHGITVAMVATILGVNVAANATESFQNTSLTVNYTSQSKADPAFGTGTQDKSLTYLRFEHVGVHDFGDNYVLVDAYDGNQIGGPGAGSFGVDTRRQYGLLWNARASLSKISGRQVGFGPVDDVSVFYRLERASYANYAANMIGPSFNFKAPGFAWLQTSFLYSKQTYSFASPSFKQGHLFWHNFAVLPFQVGGARFTFSPVLWVNFSKEATVRTEVLVEPDLWVKLGSAPLDLGLRVQYHKYKDYNRTSPTLMLRWNF